MKRPSAIVVSLALNAVLLLALARRERPVVGRLQPSGSDGGTVHAEHAVPSSDTTIGDVMGGETAAASFDWSQLSMAPWTAYRDGLRRIGCPGRTIREILDPLVRRAYTERVRTLAAPYANQFWQFAVPPSEARRKPLEEAAKALEAEERKLLEELFRGLDGTGDPAPAVDPGTEAQLGFLPASIRDRAAEALNLSNERMNEFNRSFQGDNAQRERGQKALQAELDADLAALLTPEEVAQLKLRRSQFASIRDLVGVDLSEDELAAIIRRKEQIGSEPWTTGERSESEKATIEKLLGPERAADFARAQNGEFQTLVQLTDRLEVPAGQARGLWDARQQAADLAQQAMKDPSLSDADRQARLTTLRDWLGTQAESYLIGERGRSAWERIEKDWLNQHFEVPQPDPLAVSAPP